VGAVMMMVMLCVMSDMPVFCLSIRSSCHGVCRSYMCASNSGVGPDEKKTTIEANKQATVSD